MDFGQAEIAAEQIGPRGARKPVAMQLPFRTGREQALGDEGLEDLLPARARARGGQMSGEEGVETDLAGGFEREPAAAPLARTLAGNGIQPDMHDALVVGGRGGVVREEGDLGRGGGARGVGGEGLAPGGALRVIDLAAGEDLALRDAPVVATLVFDDTPAGVFLAIFFCGPGSAETE